MNIFQDAVVGESSRNRTNRWNIEKADMRMNIQEMNGKN